MDDQQNSQNNAAASTDTSTSEEVNANTAEPTASVVNEIQPAPAPEVTEQSPVDTVQSEEGSTATDSVSDESDAIPVTVSESSPEGNEGSSLAESTAEEPALKEAPEADSTGISQSETEETKPDPFAENAEATPIAPATTTPQSMSNNEQSLNHEHRNNKKFAIIITLVVALIMAGAAVYVYISAQENTTETNQSTQTENTTNTETAEDTSPAGATDVDQATADVNQTIDAIDDTADLNEEDLSDTTLGL